MQYYLYGYACDHRSLPSSLIITESEPLVEGDWDERLEVALVGCSITAYYGV